MEINVGEYVRTFFGIGILISDYGNGMVAIDTKQKNQRYVNTGSGSITKHSKDIIDLVEVGDYVNGCKVTKINIKCPITNNKGIECKQEDKSNGYEGICFTYDNYDIKTVLTKEQFEANTYTIEKER